MQRPAHLGYLDGMACPPEEELARFVSGAAASADAVRAHLEGCALCRKTVAVLTLTRTQLGEPPGATPEPPERVGRYEVRGELGAGAMGRVLEAYDPELDRRVALKLLHGGSATDELRARLLREAQAAARVRHPNVVTVYDAGTFGEQVFLAMELVGGGTLRHWLRRPRGWRETLDVFLAAAIEGAGYRGSLLAGAQVLAGEARWRDGRAGGCATLRAGLAGLTPFPGFIGVDRARVTAAAKRCRQSPRSP